MSMKLNTHKIKPFVLPAAIILGLVFHDFCESISGIVPYGIFAILILTFSTTNLRRLRFERLDLWLMVCQTAFTMGLYWLFRLISGPGAVAQGMMLAGLTPVACSVTVVSVILGARKENTIAYTIVGNLLICVLAPIMIVMIGHGPHTDLTDSFFAMLGRISTVIGLPFFLMLALQLWARPVNSRLSRYSGLSFYLWAAVLFLTLGQTIDFIFIHGEGHWGEIAALGVGAAVLCPLQFYIGRLIGRRCGDQVAGQQLLGQKNSAMGIWIANTYLNPLASTFMAFYSICQNLLNSWQIWRKERNS